MMEHISTLNRTRNSEDINVMKHFNETKFNSKPTTENSIINDLIAEGGELFFNYLSRHGLANENNMLVLSSRHHYYYDPNELKGVTTLINIKKLNLIKHLDSFLQSVVHVLSPKTNFIGCFSDWKTQEGVGLTSRMYKGFINFLDSKIDIYIDRNGVSKLLESHGLKIIDMTEINGLTYFRAQKYGSQVN
jgi:hypothetical protein